MSFFKGLFLILIGGRFKKKSNDFDKLSDEELVDKILNTKNTLLFSILYDRYSKKIYNKCYSFSINEEEAKDLTQDVFVKLFTKLNTFQGKSKFSTWVYSFTYNFCINYVNRDSGRKLNNLSESLDHHDYHLSEIEDVDDNDFFGMRVEKLKQSLELIDPAEKAILLLKYQDNISINELQVLYNIGESAVKMRLKRAKVKVLEAYNKINND